MFQVGPLVEAEGTQPILLRTGQNQTPEWFGTNPIPYARAVALPKPSPNPSDPLVRPEESAHHHVEERIHSIRVDRVWMEPGPLAMRRNRLHPRLASSLP